MDPVNYLGDYVRGRFVKVREGEAAGLLTSENPADLHDHLGEFPFRLGAVEDAVQAARRAAGDWAGAPVDLRVRAVRKIQAQLQNRQDDLARRICRETGKPLWDARAEVDACRDDLRAVLDDGLRLVAPVTRSEGRWTFRPRGVVAVLGAAAEPARILNAHVVAALATGNTVVAKPSELAPAVGQLYAELVDEADLPRGVFNLVQGDEDLGAALAGHPGLHAVLFTGNRAGADRMQRLVADQHWKVLALHVGGKNPALVLEDADLDKAAHDVLLGAYLGAGQLRTSTRAALVHRKLFEPFVDLLAEKALRVRVGEPDRDDVLFGPMSSEAARKRFLRGVAAGEAEGAHSVVPALVLAHDPPGWYVSPSVHRIEQVLEHSAYQMEDLAGPDVAVYSVRNLDEAVALANSVDYGLATSVFTRDDRKFDWALARLEHGRVNRNAPTTAGSGRLPLGGFKKSGNHRPGGLLSVLTCTQPVSGVDGEAALEPGSAAPGLPW